MELSEVFTYINNSGLKIVCQQYYNEPTNVVLIGAKSVFEYWEFVCEKPRVSIKKNDQEDVGLDNISSFTV
ncbi:MAG: hypothetical protein K2X50_03335 [Gammaproteobacteria bacterium]|nr:hypothetical protein [Gammaproteobacteria bacterium]